MRTLPACIPATPLTKLFLAMCETADLVKRWVKKINLNIIMTAISTLLGPRLCVLLQLAMKDGIKHINLWPWISIATVQVQWVATSTVALAQWQFQTFLEIRQEQTATATTIKINHRSLSLGLNKEMKLTDTYLQPTV